MSKKVIFTRLIHYLCALHPIHAKAMNGFYGTFYKTCLLITKLPKILHHNSRKLVCKLLNFEETAKFCLTKSMTRYTYSVCRIELGIYLHQRYAI